MLDGLDEIDWERLTHSLGRADDVPLQIQALLSSDREERHAAMAELNENIFHQGIRYEAAAYAVPFLLRLLADRQTPDRAVLLEFLVGLAIGYDDEWLPDNLPIAGLRRAATGGRALLEAAPHPDDDGYDDNMGFYPYWESLPEPQQVALDAWIQVAAYDAVRAGVPLFRELVAGHDPELAAWAAYALAWFPEDAQASLPALATAASQRSNLERAVVAATALAATGLLSGTPDPSALTDRDPWIRWGAAVALARTQGPATDQTAVEELLAWHRGEHEENGMVPFLEGDLGRYATLALRLDIRHPGPEDDTLLDQLGKQSGMDAMPVVREALRTVFPDGAATGRLDEQQRTVIRTLAGSPNLWRLGGLPYANFRVLLAEHGLPDNQEAMRQHAGA